MKAAVTAKAGNPDVIEIQEGSIPDVKSGWVLIKVKAFGLNRPELFTRRGDSSGVEYPRIQGIECVGIFEEAPPIPFQRVRYFSLHLDGGKYPTNLYKKVLNWIL